MTKLSVMDVKQAIWDIRFQELFPEFKPNFEKYLKDPGCACNVKLLKALMKKKDKLRKYFPTKEIPDAEEETKNEWAVINCPIDQLETRLQSYPKTKRMVAAARWQDRVTVILNDVTSMVYTSDNDMDTEIAKAKEAPLNWEVINTTKDELLDELRKLQHGRKSLALTRWQDKITLIVNDLTVLF